VETKRIEAAGGTVEDVGGIGRVNGNLAVSRGFGDFSFKTRDDLPAEEQAVTVYPDVTVNDLDDVEYIVVACDGIWDCLTSEMLVEQTKEDINNASTVDDLTAITSNIFDQILAPNASMIGSDNMTMTIVRFKKNSKPGVYKTAAAEN